MGLQVIAGRQHVVQRAAALGQQLAHDPGDASDAAAPRVHVRSQRHVSCPGDVVVGRLLVRSVADRVVDHHHTRPRALPVGDARAGHRSVRRGCRSQSSSYRHLTAAAMGTTGELRRDPQTLAISWCRRLLLVYVVVELAVMVRAGVDDRAGAGPCCCCWPRSCSDGALGPAGGFAAQSPARAVAIRPERTAQRG